MALLASLKNIFRPSYKYIYMAGDYGVNVVDMDIAALYASQPNLRSVVSFLADNAAEVPLKVFNRKSDTDRPRVIDSTAALLMWQPGPDLTAFEFKRRMYSDLLLYERFMTLILPDKETDSGWALWPVPALWIQGYKGANPYSPDYIIIAPPSGAIEVPADKFILFHGYDPEDPMRQVSRIKALSESLYEQIESSKFRRQMWHRGGRFNAYVTRPKDVAPWSDQAFERFKDTFKNSWAGDNGGEAGAMPILEDGMEIKAIQFNAKEAEWSESVKLSREDCAAVYHVNPAMIWPGTGQTYASAKDNARALYNDCLEPILMQATDRLNLVLLKRIGEPKGNYIAYDITVKTEGTYEEKIQALSSAVGAPFLSRNEARARLDLPALPGGDDIITPLNVLVGDLASEHDTDPTVERYNSLTQAIEHAREILAIKEAEPKQNRKTRGKPTEDEKSRIAKVYRDFFKRQAKSVLAKLGAEVEDWWDEDRWNNELTDDLFKEAFDISAAVGEESVENLFDDGKYDAKRTENYIKAMCRKRAEMMNQVTHDEIEDALDDKLSEDAEKSTPEGVFENAEDNRADSAGAAFAGALVSWAAMEACNQNDDGHAKIWKTWLVTSGNPRASHAQMDGERVPYDEPFSNGAMWPGDIDALDVEEVANCQCVIEIEVEA